MNLLFSLVSDLVRVAFRLLLLAVGLAFVAGLVCLLLVFATVWALRALWAKLTGQAVTPWVMRVDPRAGWSRFTRPTWGTRGETTYADEAPAPRHANQRLPGSGDDVVDVEVKVR